MAPTTQEPRRPLLPPLRRPARLHRPHRRREGVEARAFRHSRLLRCLRTRHRRHLHRRRHRPCSCRNGSRAEGETGAMTMTRAEAAPWTRASCTRCGAAPTSTSPRLQACRALRMSRCLGRLGDRRQLPRKPALQHRQSHLRGRGWATVHEGRAPRQLRPGNRMRHGRQTCLELHGR